MKRIVKGESWAKAQRVLRVEVYPDGRTMLWIRTPHAEKGDPEGREQANWHICLRPEALLQLEDAICLARATSARRNDG